MVIPTGVSHHKFWEEAKKKNIKVKSRFTGVYFNINGKAPSWMARVQLKGKKIYKRFTFSEQGEIDASEFYKSEKLKAVSK